MLNEIPVHSGGQEFQDTHHLTSYQRYLATFDSCKCYGNHIIYIIHMQFVQSPVHGIAKECISE